MAVLADLKPYRNTPNQTPASHFHKTKEGQYQAGDVFWEIPTPAIKKVLDQNEKTATFEEIGLLLESEIHEARICGVALLVRHSRKADLPGRKRIYEYYLSHLDRVNGWDLVDISAPDIVGRMVEETQDGTILEILSQSEGLWRRRVSIVSTLWLIRKGQLDFTFAIVTRLLADQEDLIHKACGWMLRETGYHDRGRLNRFLQEHYSELPRTTLRYAIERHEESERKAILKRNFREE